MNKFDRCPCRSKALYHKCCQPFHLGELPESAAALMRSRYSAYALELVDYIIATTHPAHADSSLEERVRRTQISEFCQSTRFDGVKILEFVDGQKDATVTLTAYLRQGDADASFTEKSEFTRVDGRWLYKSGLVL